MATPDTREALGLAAFIDDSPSPFHACEEGAKRLEAVGFRRLEEVDAWDDANGRFYVVRGGALVAWIAPEDVGPSTGFRVLGAHTDSPNLRIKPRPDTGSSGCRQLGVEVYGGALLNSWLDRDLGLSGRAFVKGERGPEPRLFKTSRAVLRVPQLAIHLHRGITTDGLLLNKQTHMMPVWGLGEPREGEFREFLAEEVGADPDDVLSWDAMTHDTTPSCLNGRNEEFLSAPRIDNLCSSYAALRTLEELAGSGTAPSHVPVVTLFDHEEIGSSTRSGAGGPVLRSLLERIVLARGGTREDYHRAIADSVCVSADMAHATHPNYADRHDRDHTLYMNAGPVIKVNTNMRYASEGETEALFQVACESVDVPYQKWVMRSDLACGSTIGPITAANLGMRTVDVGCSQLAMHSAREMCGSRDPELMRRAMVAFCS